jgi:diadenosine tetraphosphate (Ap4A) HIT family hydrolase
MSETNCPFCNLDSQAERVIRYGELTTTLLSNPRLTPGHTLVVPNRHIERIAELTDEELLEVYGQIKAITAKLLDGFAAGVDVWTKTRPRIAENEIRVDHLHFHVIPSHPGDEHYDSALRWTSDRFSPLPAKERSEMLELLS